MPKFIGRTIDNSVHIDDYDTSKGPLVCLSYSQAVLLPAEEVYWSLNTTDRGGPKSYAKRWNNWFASAYAIFACPHSTCKMREAALRALPDSVRSPALDAHLEGRHEDVAAILAQIGGVQ
jgi:hypothetical protein